MKINSSVAANSYLLDAVTNNIDQGTSVRSSSLHSVRSIIMRLMMVMMIVGGWNVANGQRTTTLTNANIVAAGDGANGYQSWSLNDNNGNVYNAYAIKNQHSNATSAYHYLQIKR